MSLNCCLVLMAKDRPYIVLRYKSYCKGIYLTSHMLEVKLWGNPLVKCCTCENVLYSTAQK